MRILVLWASGHSPNLGVRVLGEGTAAILGRVWPRAEIVFHNYGARAAPVPIGSLRGIAKETVTRRGGLREWFSSFDLIVDTRAGDSFASIYGLDRHASMCAAMEYAHRCDVPIVLGPQTIGPFDSHVSEFMARRSLRTATLVMARDSESAQVAAELGRPVDVLTTDVVFALQVPEIATCRDILLNISGLLWRPNPHVDCAAYRDTVTRVYESLAAQGRTVSLLAHVLGSSGVDNDIPAVHEFRDLVAPGAEILEPTSLTDVRQMLRGAELVIGSRMHACLNALSVSTPAIPLAYSRKFAPLLGDVGWRHLVDLRTSAGKADEIVGMCATDPTMSEQAAHLRSGASALLDKATVALRDVVSAGAP